MRPPSMPEPHGDRAGPLCGGDAGLPGGAGPARRRVLRLPAGRGAAGHEHQRGVPGLPAGHDHPWGHYHRHDRTLEDGDFVILDAAPDYAYHNVDVSTSFPANGRFTPEQRALYELGEGIHQVCLANYRPGTTFAAVGEQVRLWLEENGYDATADRFRGLIRWGYYNHPIGLATHDVMSSMTGPDEPLEPGFVFACDINMPQTETLGIRIEDTVVITEDGYENLSAGLPRTVEEIEALMRQPGLLQKMGR